VHCQGGRSPPQHFVLWWAAALHAWCWPVCRGCCLTRQCWMRHHTGFPRACIIMAGGTVWWGHASRFVGTVSWLHHHLQGKFVPEHWPPKVSPVARSTPAPAASQCVDGLQLALAAYSGIQLLLVSQQIGVSTVSLGYACQRRLRAAECAINFIAFDSCSLPCCFPTGQAALTCDHISCQ